MARKNLYSTPHMDEMFRLPSRFDDPRYGEKLALKRLGLITASNVESGTIKWAIQDVVPIGCLSLLAGAPNVGKNLLLNAMASVVTNGRNQTVWPSAVEYDSAHVLISSTEENFAVATLPRAMGVGVALNRFHNLQTLNPNAKARFDGFNLLSPDHCKDFILGINALNSGWGIGLLALDPWSQIMTRDSGNNAAVQEAMTTLTRIAEQLQCGIIGVAHTSKSARGKPALSRVVGPRAVTGCPRNVMIAAKIESGPLDDGATHILIQAKTMGALLDYALTYSIEEVTVNTAQGPINVPRIKFHGKLYGSPDENLRRAEAPADQKKISKLDDAIKFLKSQLSNGAKLHSELFELARECEISEGTLVRAKRALGVKSEKLSGAGQFAGFICSLPE